MNPAPLRSAPSSRLTRCTRPLRNYPPRGAPEARLKEEEGRGGEGEGEEEAEEEEEEEEGGGEGDQGARDRLLPQELCEYLFFFV